MRAPSPWMLCALAVAAAVPAIAQRFETGATAVVVDVVVRDKAGRFVTGLTPADFTVTEDGVQQPLTSLALIGDPAARHAATAGPPAGAATPASAAIEPAPTAPAQPRFSAVVFDRLESETMAMAREGGRAAVDGASPADLIAVFVVDNGLRVVQGFTTDKARLRTAVDLAVQRAAMLITREANGVRHDRGGVQPTVPGAEFANGSVGADDKPAFDERGIPAEMFPSGSPTRNSWEMLLRQVQGRVSTDALLVAGAALSTLPGRKTLYYFTDAIAVPDEVLHSVFDVVATANRGQVTIYAIDTTGLRVGSQDAATRREIMRMGNSGLAVNADGSNSSSLAMMERNEDILRRSPRVGLTMLARPTGGFLIDNTNDLAAGVRRIEEDRRVHYLLTYAPARAELDGTWRAIDVKVNRKNVTVQARQGYVAVRSPGVLPVLVYEGRALAAVGRTPMPREIPTRAGAFVFPRVAAPEPGKPAIEDVAVVVAAPAAPLTFDVKGSAYATDFTMLALLRDQSGEAIHKTSQPYRLTGPAASREQALRSEVRFARTLATPPGSYTVWGTVHDTKSGRAGVAERRLTVEGRGPSGLGVSSLVLLSRLEPAKAPQPDDPLVVGGRLITPNLGEPMFKTPDARLGFYFLIVGADPGERLQARLQFYQHGIPEPKPLLLDAPLPLEPADARGVVRPLGALPLKDLPVGSLEARLIVDRGGQQDVRSAFFRLESPRSDGSTR